MKQWLMVQNFTALNTMYRKTCGKQSTYRSPQWTEKQIDYILIKRRHATQTNNKQRKIAKEKIRAQIDNKDGNKEASTFAERYQELEE